MAATLSVNAAMGVSLQMQLGNPSGATSTTNNHIHYLVQRTVEALDFSDNLGEPNWVSWDLTGGDIGGSGRNSTFYTDTNLPTDFYWVKTADYTYSGYSRGHMCPSEDRTDTTNDNKLVFYMSNIVPQNQNNNAGVWSGLENTCQSLAMLGNEVLITCGPAAFSGARINTNGPVSIPGYLWKIAVVVPPGSGSALSRITVTNRVIAVYIPNIDLGTGVPWSNYVTSVNQLQTNTGFNFFTALPDNIATVLRAKVDGTPPPGITNYFPASGNIGATVTLKGTNFSGASTVWFNGTNANFTLNASNQIIATVPAGATTGPISVIAPGGLAVSTGNFTVATPPTISAVSFNGGQFSLVVTGAAAASYTVYGATNLNAPQWIALLTTNPATLPFTFTDTNRYAQRFYRVLNP
jgi:endonuclease G